MENQTAYEPPIVEELDTSQGPCETAAGFNSAG
jgi:hypothetical protein